MLQPAAIDGPVARARAGRRQAAKLRPAVAAKRVRLRSAITPAASSAPTPGSYFSGAATALMMGVSSNTKKGGSCVASYLRERCFGGVRNWRQRGCRNDDAFVDSSHAGWFRIIGPVEEQKLLLIILNAL